jgi:large subunit ribosomal protein LP0
MDIRSGLRAHSTVLMGKNTMMKRCVRLYCERGGDDKWAVLLDQLVGNVGLVFTQGDLSAVRDEIMKFKVGAPARVGLVAPNDVTVPAGNTGLDPSQTSFFQALNIPTKINKGTVEIVSDVALIKEGDKVGGSEATLLAKLGIRPFSYGLVVTQVIDGGAIYDPKVLDITDADLLANADAAVANVAALSLALGFPTAASVVHDLVRGYKNVLAVAVATEYDFPLADKVKADLADPSAFAAPSGGGGGGGGGGDAAPAKEAKKEESEEEDDDMGFSLFD